MKPKYLLFIILALVVIGVDQATKIWVVNNIEFRTGAIPVIPGFFDLVHAQNPGAAFGLLRDSEYRHLVFLGFTIVAGGIIVDMLRKLPDDDRFVTTNLGLIMGGAFGNAIDRVHKGTVTDFLRIYTDNPTLRDFLVNKTPLHSAEWPSFNVADAALVVGVILFMIYYLFIEQAEDDDVPSVPEPESEPNAANTEA